jgi:Ni,Fe-hydrogenase III large subunit
VAAGAAADAAGRGGRLHRGAALTASALPQDEPPIRLANGGAVARARVPRLPLEGLRQLVMDAPERGRRVAALFGHRAGGGALELVVVLAADASGALELARAEVAGDRFPSMTPRCPEVQLFEREIAERWGVQPEGHPWLKPVRFPPQAGQAPAVGLIDYYRVEGDEIHEVAVGPVHAGVIEPGHFRFQCLGEEVLHLEISLGYQHRGVARALLGGPDKRTIHYMETLAGDTSIGHATAYCQLHEALSATRVPARAHALRAVALELERLANHTGGLGALANDVGFLPTASFCGRLRGDFLNLTAALCGSRFGRGLVRPGGTAFDLPPEQAGPLAARLAAAARDAEGAVGLLWSTASVQARFEETGRVSPELARELGLVGVAARASGLKRDVRASHPWGLYRFVHVPTSTWASGDVFARAYVRWLEMQRSVAFLRAQLDELPAGPVRAASGALRPDQLAVSLVEGWRGEICHVALTDGQGRFAAYQVVDPSFHNWSGLAHALRGQPISDFPLCNKSFDLSYCGHDL